MNPRSQVTLVRCPGYDLVQVEQALRTSLDMLGGLGRYIKPGYRVLLKVNLLRAMPPEAAATTHPALAAMMAKLVLELGAQPILLDSPGGPFTPAMLRIIYRKTGMLLAEQYGAELNYDVSTIQAANPEGLLLHRLDIVRRLLDVDAVINMPKLKTHNLSGLTCAVKNLFGLVPGMTKVGYHAKLPDRYDFCDGMLDILTYTRPVLNVLDAVVAMEGNGPSGGNPRQVGAILVSDNALSLDVAASSLVSFEPLSVLTTLAAVNRGLTSGRLQDIEILGDDLDALRVPDFRKGTVALVDPGLVPGRLQTVIATDGQPAARSGLREISRGWWAKQLLVTPRASPACVGCGICVKHCPVQAIILVNGKARMDAGTCIRCYCCHELCPELAIELRRPWLGRLFFH